MDRFYVVDSLARSPHGQLDVVQFKHTEWTGSKSLTPLLEVLMDSLTQGSLWGGEGRVVRGGGGGTEGWGRLGAWPVRGAVRLNVAEPLPTRLCPHRQPRYKFPLVG